MFPKVRDDGVTNPKPKKGKDTSSLNKKPTSSKCGKGHLSEYIGGTGNFFSCGKSGTMLWISQMSRAKKRGVGKKVVPIMLQKESLLCSPLYK